MAIALKHTKSFVHINSIFYVLPVPMAIRCFLTRRCRFHVYGARKYEIDRTRECILLCFAISYGYTTLLTRQCCFHGYSVEKYDIERTHKCIVLCVPISHDYSAETAHGVARTSPNLKASQNSLSSPLSINKIRSFWSICGGGVFWNGKH